MKTQWIVIANAASARIFRRETATAPLVLVEALVHDRSRMHASALESDRPGSHAADYGRGLNHFEPRCDARRKEHQRFAKEIAQRLDVGVRDNEFATLTLFASNPFMGELKAQLSDAVTRRLKLALNNDLSHVGVSDLERRVSGTWSAML